MQLPCADDTTLQSLRLDDAERLVQMLDADRDTFDRWLRWSGDIRNAGHARAFIAGHQDREAAGLGFHLGIWRGDVLLGGVPCWWIDDRHRVAEIGYWLGADVRGRGLATQAARAVMHHLFTARGINRVEMQCRVENAASRRVAERAGGRLEGIRRQSHLIGGAFRDHAVYAVLATDSQDLEPELPEEQAMVKGLRTVIYHVPDLARAREWYRAAFGIEPYFDEPFYVGFNVGGFELGLDPDVSQVAPGPGGSVAYWGVASITEAVERFVGAGAELKAPAQDVGGGIKVATVADPFGNLLGLIENPHFTTGS